MSRSRHFHILFVVLVALALAGPQQGCRCSSEPEPEVEQENPTAELPTEFPRAASETAPALAARLPSDVDTALFVSSFASIVDIIDQAKRWNLVDVEELSGIFASLERYHGINPGSARSWKDNGFSLTDGMAIGLIGGKSVFVVMRVADRERFEKFLDTFINQEFGRPRRHQSDHNGVSLTGINVLKRDLGTVAYVGDFVYVVAGERLIDEAPSSLDVMKRLLDVGKGESLGDQPQFSGLLERLADGPLFLFTLERTVPQRLLAPLSKDDKPLQKTIDEGVIAGIDAFGVGLKFEDSKLHLRSHATLKPETRTDMMALVSPDPPETKNLHRFLGPDVTGLARMTFSPEEAESVIQHFLDEKQQKTWKKIKSNASVRLLLNFEDEVLYNLSGQALATVFDMDEEKMSGAGKNANIMRGLDGAVYLTFRDKAKSNAYFGKISMLKDLVPKGQVEFEERADGVLLVGILDKRRVMMRVAYHDGVLAVIFGDANIETAIERMKASTGPAPTGSWATLLETGAVWGLTIDMKQVVAYLSARYEVVKLQINKFLAPLQKASVFVRFSDEGLGLDVSIEMTPGG